MESEEYMNRKSKKQRSCQYTHCYHQCHRNRATRETRETIKNICCLPDDPRRCKELPDHHFMVLDLIYPAGVVSQVFSQIAWMATPP